MEKSTIGRLRDYVSGALLVGALIILLSMVRATNPELPAGETIGQWVWFGNVAKYAAGCILIALFLSLRGGKLMDFARCISFALMVWGGVEAVWGLFQLFGYAASGHARYALTGSFFNPGPYAGYLAMALPVCLYRWLALRSPWASLKMDEKIEKVLVGGAGICILCVLPATLSRSAWLAALISCLWIYGMDKDWGGRCRSVWRENKRKAITVVVGIAVALVLGGSLLFILKPDSAKGRLLMWKTACRAVAEKPLTGHGIGSFAGAYGEAQEKYFAGGTYAGWEEQVAGSPEYAFNEYLRCAVEGGILVTVCLLSVIGICLFCGWKKRRWGVCGAILSLLIFSFSSYPLQIPVFIVTFVCLLAACVIGKSPIRWGLFAVAVLIIGIGSSLRGGCRYDACREWANVGILYHAGAYEQASASYGKLLPLLGDRAAFLFEYGHCLHKQGRGDESNRILKDALKRSSDPMILNIMGKNCQQKGDYLAAEAYYIRAVHRLPGRIYPYYLLAKLYAEPGFCQPEKFEAMKRMVLTKEPKVMSTAIREMREELKKLSKKIVVLNDAVE